MRHVKLNFLPELRSKAYSRLSGFQAGRIWLTVTKNLGGADFKRHKAKVTT